ncbi:MAG: hypothetical protein NWE93_08165 [Candidatus Bathyarchaeota archaeon]|nr:hypothetical protein [Candidatus Bathyarchaeota archaeon]
MHRNSYQTVHEKRQLPVTPPGSKTRVKQDNFRLTVFLIIIDLFWGCFFFGLALDSPGWISLFAVGWMIAGIILGAGLGVLSIRRVMRKLFEDHRYQMDLRGFLPFVPLTIFAIFAAYADVVFNEGPTISPSLAFVVSGLALITAAAIARYVLFPAFEKRENMRLMIAGFGGGIVAVPKENPLMTGCEAGDGELGKEGGGAV